LERFAQFFIAPLLNESTHQREVKAVDNEHSKNLQVDAWRFQQLERSTALPTHPYSKFGTGDAITLDQLPKTRGVDVRKKLLEFHAEYYKANRMGLVIVGREPVETLSNWVKTLFNDVPRGSDAIQQQQASISPEQIVSVFPNEILNRMMFVEPIKEKYSIEVFWQLPPLTDKYRSNPAHYLSNLFGHESKGSILANLKARALAVGLSGGLSFECSDFSLFKVTVDCTEKGATLHYRDVVETIFRYAKMAREAGVSERIFEEIRELDQIRFRFMSKPDVFQFSRNTSAALLKYPAAEVLTAETVVKEFDPKLTQNCLDLLVPERARVFVAFKNCRAKIPQLDWMNERWYGTVYALDNSESLTDLVKLRKGLMAESEGPPLHLPEENIFIPKHFTLFTPEKLDDAGKKQALLRPPSLASGTPQTLQTWYKQDRTFCQPKAVFKASLILPASYTSPRASVLAELSGYIVSDALNEFAYMAEIAGLSWSYSNTVRGMQFGVAGYNDKLGVLLEKMVTVATNIETYRNQSILDRQLERYQRALDNFQKENPYQIAMYEASVTLNVPRWNIKDKLKALKAKQVTVDELCRFVQANIICGASHLVTLSLGNITRQLALQYSELAWSKFQFETYFVPTPPRVIAVPKGKMAFLRLQNENINSAFELVAQIGPESKFPKCAALTQLVTNLADEPCFNSLRTQQQLGYIVSLGMRRDFSGVLGIRIVVQSGTFDLDFILQKSIEFLYELRSILEAYSDEEFHDHIRACVSNRLESDINIAQEAKRWWDEIEQGSRCFDRDQIVAKEVASLTKREVMDFYERFLNPKSNERRFFASGVDGTKQPKTMPQLLALDANNEKFAKVESDLFGEVTHIEESNVMSWKDGCELWGLLERPSFL
jgi:insulysin